jgi:carbamate kinase
MTLHALRWLQIAAALQAEKLILMTDVPGVLKDKDDVATKFASLNIRECRKLTDDGIIAGGMIPKVQCCIRCLSQVRSALGVAQQGGWGFAHFSSCCCRDALGVPQYTATDQHWC